MKRIFAVIISMTLFFALAIPAFAALPAQDVSCTAGFVGGDVDGDGKVTSADAAELMKHLTGWQIPGDASHADTLRDGVVNAKDAAKLMQYLAGWNVGRLCHDDEYAVVEDPTVDKEGKARHTCRVCGDYTEETLPLKTFSVCGTDITEYSVIFASNGILNGSCEHVVSIMNATADEIFGGMYEFTQVTTKSAKKKTYAHEILIGDLTAFTREGLPEVTDSQPYYGVTEDGTVFFSARNLGLFQVMWTDFLREYMGVDFCIVNNDGLSNPKVALVSYDENGADVQPFVRHYVPVDLEAEGYKLVFEDDFDGDDLDWDVWMNRAPGARRGGFNDGGQVSVSDGKLRLRAEYRENGPRGTGWYSGMLALNQWYSRGYFEARIKCSDNDGGFWSAFWIQGRAPYTPDQSQGGIGPGGCEIDILELFGNEGLTYNLYVAGSELSDNKDGYDGFHSYNYTMGDMINEYHTYALEWDEDYYTFYVDGILVGRTSFCDGTSSAEEQVILSLEISEKLASNTDYTTEMDVDYIRIYQK